MPVFPVSSPVEADGYAGILAAFGEDGTPTGMVLIGNPDGDGFFECEFRPFDDSPHPGWKARYDRDRTCVEVLSGEPS